MQTIITEDKEIAKTFNDYFITTVSSLAITENKALSSDVSKTNDPVGKAVKSLRITQAFLI